MLHLFLKCFPKRLGTKRWDCHYYEELENKRTAGVFGVLGAVTLRIPSPKVKSNYVFVCLSSCIINYKKLRKKPSQILPKNQLKVDKCPLAKYILGNMRK